MGKGFSSRIIRTGGNILSTLISACAKGLCKGDSLVIILGNSLRRGRICYILTCAAYNNSTQWPF